MTPNVEQVFLTAINTGALYADFVRRAHTQKTPSLYYVNSYEASCTRMWTNAAWSGLHAHRKAIRPQLFQFTPKEMLELAYCLAVYYADHLAEQETK